MRKSIKRIISIVLIIMTLISSYEVVCADSIVDLNDYEVGDMNFDNKLNANDALEVLKLCAKLMQPNNYSTACGDFNYDGLLNAEDALCILKKAAGIIVEYSYSIDNATLKDKKYAKKDLEYILDIVENSEGMFDGSNISKLSVCDMITGGKPELALIDDINQHVTYVVCENDGEVMVEEIKTAVRGELVYLGGYVGQYGMAVAHAVEGSIYETVINIYLE